jgi:hypothetical protein
MIHLDTSLLSLHVWLNRFDGNPFHILRLQRLPWTPTLPSGTWDMMFIWLFRVMVRDSSLLWAFSDMRRSLQCHLPGSSNYLTIDNLRQLVSRDPIRARIWPRTNQSRAAFDHFPCRRKHSSYADVNKGRRWWLAEELICDVPWFDDRIRSKTISDGEVRMATANHTSHRVTEIITSRLHLCDMINHFIGIGLLKAVDIFVHLSDDSITNPWFIHQPIDIEFHSSGSSSSTIWLSTLLSWFKLRRPR